MNRITHGKTLQYWKDNAEEDYMRVPISVLKYITILEEELKQAQELPIHNVVGSAITIAKLEKMDKEINKLLNDE